MADTQAESPDSRTSVVGRKRDLHDPQHGKSADPGDSSEGERSHKRVKTDVPVQGTYSGLVLAPDASQSTAQQPGQVEVEGSSLLARAKLMLEPLTAGSDEVAHRSSGDRPGEAQAVSEAQNNPIFPTTWNTGVQSGLRTSFAGKSKRRSRQARATSLTEEGSKIDIDPAIASVFQENASTPLDQDGLGSWDDKNDELMNDGEALIDQEQLILDFPAQYEGDGPDILIGAGAAFELLIGDGARR